MSDEGYTDSHLVTITEHTNEDSNFDQSASNVSYSQMLVNDLKQMMQSRKEKSGGRQQNDREEERPAGRVGPQHF